MKTSGAIKNLVQGVSTQNPKERLEGQVWTMSNCIPDPVEGAVKRPAVKHIASLYSDLPTSSLGLPLEFRAIAMETGEYAVGTYDGRVVLRDLATGGSVPVYQDPASYPYFVGGIKAHANIGEYTLLAGTAIPVAQTQQLQGIHTSAYTSNAYGATAVVNRVVIVEVRQGAYSGVYAIKRSDGSVLATYTVPNGATGTDSVNVQPSYIAGQLYTQLQTAIGGSVGSGIIRAVQSMGASVAIFLSFSAVDESAAMYADDGFYNTRMVMSDRFATVSNTLPSVGVEGHIMEVGKANSRSGNYFLRFEHTQGGSTSVTPSVHTNKVRPGRWVETSQSYISTGYSVGGIITETTLPSLLYIFNGVAYVGSGTYIAAQVLAQTGVVLTPLAWGRRTAGNDDSSPDPFFVGSAISWLGIFQDRLVVLSKGAVTMSRTGDYLNFYRESVLDDLATDPINLTSTFDATDTLVGAALLDKNLIVIGTKTHYAIVGRVGITPTNGALLKTSSFESNPSVPPVSFGNLVYFSSASDTNADILAIQPSDTADSTYAYPVSSHVDGYIPSDIASLTSSTKLNILFVLSSSGVLYGYRTLFNQGERVLSAWFDFQFPSDLTLKCITIRNTKIRMLFSKLIGSKYITTVGELDLDRVGYTGVERHRYLDFWSDFTAVAESYVRSGNLARGAYSSQDSIAVDNDSDLAETTGIKSGITTDVAYSVTYEGLTAGKTYMTGVPYLMKFEPTMPLPKTYDGKITGVGKLIVGQMKVNYTVGAQFDVLVSDKYRNNTYSHSARIVSAPDSLVGESYVREGFCMFPIGSAESSARVAIQSYDHYPLVLSSIDWTGQFFKRGATM
jgi:hypothetical protein